MAQRPHSVSSEWAPSVRTSLFPARGARRAARQTGQTGQTWTLRDGPPRSQTRVPSGRSKAAHHQNSVSAALQQHPTASPALPIAGCRVPDGSALKGCKTLAAQFPSIGIVDPATDLLTAGATSGNSVPTYRLGRGPSQAASETRRSGCSFSSCSFLFLFFFLPFFSARCFSPNVEPANPSTESATP